MNELNIAGITARNACGRIINDIVKGPLKPNACAASY
jgi:hypothetical protein